MVPALSRGGAERQLVALVCNTSSRFDHVVCCLGEAEAFADEIRFAGHRVIEWGLSGKYRWFSGAMRVSDAVRTEKPDILQTWLLDASIATRLAQLTGPRVPSVRALQDFIYESETIRVMDWSPWKVGARKLVDRVTAAWAKPLVVTPSVAWERAAREHLGLAGNQIQTIYNSVDPRVFAATADEAASVRASMGIPATAMVFLNVGRLDPQKGQRCLLQAFALTANEVPDSYLVIVGGGRLKNELEAESARLGIADRVRFMGIRRDVGAFLRAADVFVFPSVFEGLGLALAEAMCQGLPCIASRLPALEEVITADDEGILVPPSQPANLAEAMIALHHDASRRAAIAKRGQDEALRRFHVTATVPQWESLYTDLHSAKLSGSRI